MDIRLRIALEIYGKGKISTSESAGIAGISVGEMMDELVRAGLKSDISLDDIKGSLERATKVIK